jgi:hypothetical protein
MRLAGPGEGGHTDPGWFLYQTALPAGAYRYRFAVDVGGHWFYWPELAGTYLPGPNVVNPGPGLSSGYVTPGSGTGATLFTWRVKYWSTQDLAPDEVLVAVWFPALKRAYWYRMWALDPTDTTYKSDGAWYAFSRKWLPPGALAFRFAARQGTNWAYWPTPAGSYQACPSVYP